MPLYVCPIFQGALYHSEEVEFLLKLWHGSLVYDSCFKDDASFSLLNQQDHGFGRDLDSLIIQPAQNQPLLFMPTQYINHLELQLDHLCGQKILRKSPYYFKQEMSQFVVLIPNSEDKDNDTVRLLTQLDA